MDPIALIIPGIFAACLAIIGWLARNHLNRIKLLEKQLTDLLIVNQAQAALIASNLESIKNIESDAHQLSGRFNDHLVLVTRNAATASAILDGIKEQITYQLHHIDEKVDRIIEREIEGKE